MYRSKKILAVVPARGNSKGLPGKNILPLLGKPVIAWTIEQALANPYLDKVIVSTDDKEIADVSKKYGAEVPFLRPAELSTDTAKGIDVLLHAMDWMEKNEGVYDIVVYLQPTSPLRTSADISAALRIMEEKKAKAVVSVCKTEHSPLWTNILPDDHSLKGFLREDIVNKNRQELDTFYRLNGAVYLADSAAIVKSKSWFMPGSYACVMPAERSVDIDSEMDMVLAELLMKKEL